jgi:murein DD-endopeptidase MepM/ murein hydrolase activator NlpD
MAGRGRQDREERRGPRGPEHACGRSLRGSVPALAALLLLAAAGCATPPRGALAAAWSGTAAEAAYYLPFPAGYAHVCVQEGPGPFSHQGSQRYAVDFAMPVGSPVVAARDGRVIAVREDSNRGGRSPSFADDGNYVLVLHADGTRGLYLHLERDGALVSVGEDVRRGQRIARSGNTGWSAMPHLHFQVDARDPASGRWGSTPFRFADVAGDGRPRMLRTYQSANVLR